MAPAKSSQSFITYHSKRLRGQLGLLKEWDGKFACDNTQASLVSCLEQLVEGALLLRREIGLGCSVHDIK